MPVSERLRSRWGPSRLAHYGDLRSSQWSKPQELHQPPFDWKNKSLLWYSFRCGRPHQSLQPSVTALSSRAIFMFRWIRLSFIHRTLALNCLFSTCHVKELACFYEPQFGRVSLNISLSDSVLETKRLHGEVLNYSSFLLLQNVNFDGLTFLTALVLYSQSDSNRDSDWLIVARFVRVWSMLTTLLSALGIKVVLKIESKAWEFAWGI